MHFDALLTNPAMSEGAVQAQESADALVELSRLEKRGHRLAMTMPHTRRQARCWPLFLLILAVGETSVQAQELVLSTGKRNPDEEATKRRGTVGARRALRGVRP